MKELAPIVRRRTPTFPTRWANYFDLTKWGGGYIKCGSGPGAIDLPNGMRCELRSGTVAPATAPLFEGVKL